jgi:hypothetical protein
LFLAAETATELNEAAAGIFREQIILPSGKFRFSADEPCGGVIFGLGVLGHGAPTNVPFRIIGTADFVELAAKTRTWQRSELR